MVLHMNDFDRCYKPMYVYTVLTRKGMSFEE
jgi:hypothetical protein